MIPGLLHGRLLGGGGGGGSLINPPDWAGHNYFDADYRISGTATAEIAFTIKSDGTFRVVDADANVKETGNWHSGAVAGIGAGYEVRFTVTGSSGLGSVTNGASAFTSVSADRTIKLTATRSTLGAVQGERTVLVEIRPTAGAVGASGSFTMGVDAETGG